MVFFVVAKENSGRTIKQLENIFRP